MVLIPNDAGVRLRSQSDVPLHPIAPVTDLPADLTDFHTGQQFSARIQQVLPENTYKALVAGRSLTLSLPEGAKAGDTLELVVVDRTPRTIVAQLANRPATTDGAGEAYQFTTLSRAAQVIGALLAREGDKPAPAALSRGFPLLAHAPTDAAELAPRLAKAASLSGLFYESHQVQWAQGQRPLADLLAEPQAAHSRPEVLAAYRQAAIGTPVTASGGKDANSLALLQNLLGTEARPASVQATLENPAGSIPEELRPLVQQQLDAAASQRLAWHGEVWPGQTLRWEVEPDARHPDHDAAPEQGWITSLHLTMPRLGGIDARIHLTSQGVRIAILAPGEDAEGDLRAAAPALDSALAASGIPLLGLQLAHDDGNA